MCGISWCQGKKADSGSETFKLSSTTIALADALNTVRSKYNFKKQTLLIVEGGGGLRRPEVKTTKKELFLFYVLKPP